MSTATSFFLGSQFVNNLESFGDSFFLSTLKGLSHEIDFKSFDKNLQNLV
jgi:hypothetical protein